YSERSSSHLPATSDSSLSLRNRLLRKIWLQPRFSFSTDSALEPLSTTTGTNPLGRLSRMDCRHSIVSSLPFQFRMTTGITDSEPHFLSVLFILAGTSLVETAT